MLPYQVGRPPCIPAISSTVIIKFRLKFKNTETFKCATLLALTNISTGLIKQNAYKLSSCIEVMWFIILPLNCVNAYPCAM